MANYNGNQQPKRESVYTNGYQLYNSETNIYPSTLQLSHWDNFARFTICPAKDKSQRTENSVYDYDTKISSALGVNQCVTLLRKIEDKIEPAMKTGEQCSVGVVTGGNNQLAVYTNNGQCMLMIFKDIDAQTKQPSQKYGYVFNNTMVIENYNPEDGTHSISEYSSELEVLKIFLRTCAEAASGAHAHQDDFKNRFKKKDGQSNSSNYKPSPFGSGSGATFGGNDNAPTQQDNLQYASELNKLLGN